MTAKILAQATSSAIMENPQKLDEILAYLKSKILPRYKTIKWSKLIHLVIDDIASRQGIEQYKVISATDLDNQTNSKLQEELGSGSIIYKSQNANILGGLIIKGKTRQLDLSIERKLNLIKQNLSSGDEL
jgi:hypothetical protein